MNKLIRLLPTAGLLLLLAAAGASAQRARTVSPTTAEPTPSPVIAADNTPLPAPQAVKAKYEGGIFGFNQKQTGTLSFDDVNHRLIFRDKRGHEYLSMAYDAIVAAFADTRSRRPTSATILGSASIYTLPALLIRKKYRYLTLQFNDPDSQVQGTTSFKLDNKETLTMLLATVAQRADLTQRGEAYVRRPRNRNPDATP